MAPCVFLKVLIGTLVQFSRRDGVCNLGSRRISEKRKNIRRGLKTSVLVCLGQAWFCLPAESDLNHELSGCVDS